MSADSQDNNDDNKLIYFPSLAERDRMRKEQKKVEEQDNGGRKKSSSAGAEHVPFLNWGKIPPFTGIVGLVFIALQVGSAFFLDDGQILRLWQALGFVPAHYSSLAVLQEQWGILYLLSPFTYGFFHGGWMHLIFNVVMWMALGSFFEKEFGTKAAIRFFFIAALGGAAAHFLAQPFAEQAMIGASASISGCFAAALVLFYKRGMMGPRGRYGIMPLIILWVLLMVILGAAGGGTGDNIAWVAHLGGFMTGLLYISRKFQGHFKFWKL